MAQYLLLWIQPFLDGNGRLTRLMSHAMLLDLAVGSAHWSCLDHTHFMRELHVRDEEDAEHLPKRSFALLREALLAGELDRGRVPRLLDVSEPTARRVVSGVG